MIENLLPSRLVTLWAPSWGFKMAALADAGTFFRRTLFRMSRWSRSVSFALLSTALQRT